MHEGARGVGILITYIQLESHSLHFQLALSYRWLSSEKFIPTKLVRMESRIGVGNKESRTIAKWSHVYGKGLMTCIRWVPYVRHVYESLSSSRERLAALQLMQMEALHQMAPVLLSAFLPCFLRFLARIQLNVPTHACSNNGTHGMAWQSVNEPACACMHIYRMRAWARGRRRSAC